MPYLFPQIGIEFSIERAGLGMPAPPQIISKFIEPANTGGHNGKDCHAAIDFHRIWFLSVSSLLKYILVRKQGQCRKREPGFLKSAS
jgi:hypothetical protein